MLVLSQKLFTMEVGGGKDTISLDCLKPYLGPSPITPASLHGLDRPPWVALSASTTSPCGLGFGGHVRLLILQPDSIKKSGNLGRMVAQWEAWWLSLGGTVAQW